MGHCKDCRWWDRNRPVDTAVPPFGSEDKDSRPSFACANPELMATGIVYSCLDRIWTLPDFGCIQFEKALPRLRQTEPHSDGTAEQIHVRVLPDGRMTRHDAAQYLGLKSHTLANWQVAGKGPRSIRVGGRHFYFRDDLDAFIRNGEAT
jgi:Helix-turn-helix domain